MPQLRFSYPVDLSTNEAGRVIARVADLQGCVTDGASREAALIEATDALEEALAAKMAAREAVNPPSAAMGRPTVAPGAVIAAKVALYSAMRDSNTSNVALASRLGCVESEVRRMLDPAHATKIGRLENALAIFGQRVVITVEAA